MGGEYTFMLEQFVRNMRALDKSLKEHNINKTADQVLDELLDAHFSKASRSSKASKTDGPQGENISRQAQRSSTTDLSL